jgi:pimeloyl-ACP methyl ester carboxylesterase
MSRPPSWFTGAIANRPEFHAVEVDGCRINYLCWGDPSDPGLILLHGGAAHAHWWSFIAPQFTNTRSHRYFVVAPDLSGHGDSGRRDVYSMEVWADEIMAVAHHAGVQGRPIVVGHSMGGHVAIAAAARDGAELDGAIIVDAPVREPDPESEEGERGRMFRNPKTYPDLEPALEHFHLQPPQPVTNDYVVEHIARHSLREVEGGWTWKFDPNVFVRERHATIDYLRDTRCRLALMHGQLSDLVTAEVQSYMEELTGRNAPMVEIPQAYHHIPLDQPLALIAAIRAVLADWQHSIDKKRLRDLTA